MDLLHLLAHSSDSLQLLTDESERVAVGARDKIFTANIENDVRMCTSSESPQTKQNDCGTMFEFSSFIGNWLGRSMLICNGSELMRFWEQIELKFLALSVKILRKWRFRV